MAVVVNKKQKMFDEKLEEILLEIWRRNKHSEIDNLKLSVLNKFNCSGLGQC